MAIELDTLYAHDLTMMGDGLTLAGSGFDLKKLLKSVSKVTDVGLGLTSALGDEKTQSRAAQAQAVKSVLDQSGRGLKMPTVSKAQAKKAKTAGKKALNIGLNLADEFGSAKTKAQSAKVRKAKEIITGSGKPGADLRQMIMKHHYGI